jgi:hypothetical protein
LSDPAAYYAEQASSAMKDSRYGGDARRNQSLAEMYGSKGDTFSNIDAMAQATGAMERAVKGYDKETYERDKDAYNLLLGEMERQKGSLNAHRDNMFNRMQERRGLSDRGSAMQRSSRDRERAIDLSGLDYAMAAQSNLPELLDNVSYGITKPLEEERMRGLFDLQKEQVQSNLDAQKSFRKKYSKSRKRSDIKDDLLSYLMY